MSKKIGELGKDLHSTGTETIPPDPSRMILALRQIGYSLEQAVSDLVDNSINAEAVNVLVRFITKGNGIHSFVIADNGWGMSAGELADAMKFGSEKESDIHSLGKYGMGLKLASLSYAKSLTVVTKKSGRCHARRWTIEGIQSGWNCEVLDSSEAKNIIESPWGELDLSKSGTLVIWDDIDKLPVSSSGVDATLRTLQRRIQLYIGLYFHRFLEDGRLNVVVDRQEFGEEENQIKIDVEDLNPFGYEQSGDEDYPKMYKAKIEGVGELRADAHIWPPNSDRKEYKLGGNAAARQGFYFYRNDRLIQAGGWNGIVQNQSEPHSSLARVRIDLPAQYDSSFGLNVQKSAVVVPPAFEKGIAKAKSDDGDSFDDYRRAAQLVYRKKDTGAHKFFPLVLGEGVPKKLIGKAKEILSPTRGRTRQVSFEWVEFASGDLFEIDRNQNVIYLNRAYRKDLLAGLKASGSDLPMLKTMIFLLVKEDFNKSKTVKQRKLELEQINKLLIEAAKIGKG